MTLLADIPSLEVRPKKDGIETNRPLYVRPHPRRRSFLKGVAALSVGASLSVIGSLPPARAADPKDIRSTCPSAISGDCSPGCGPSAVCSDCCSSCTSNPNACICPRWHKQGDATVYKWRVNQCPSGSIYDGWNWQVSVSYCAGCQVSITYRCHDGYKKISGSWVPKICRSVVGCGNCTIA